MTSHTVSNDYQLKQLFTRLQNRKRPFTVEVVDGRKRSVDQNRLAHLWFKEAAEQLGDRTPSDVRAYCKLKFGIPILKDELEGFAEKYDRIIQPHHYTDRLEMMVEPFDFPVSRLMSVEQESRWLDRIHEFLSSQGVVLTNPEDRRNAA